MKYPFSCFPVTDDDPEDVTWIARSNSLPGCIAHGASPIIAIAYLEFEERQWLDAAFANGIYIPPIPIQDLASTTPSAPDKKKTEG